MTAPTAPLGELANVVSGGTPKRSEPSYFGGDIPWVKIGDMLQGTVANTEESITNAGLTGSSAKLLPAGTLLFSIFATIGRTAVLGIDAATNQAIAGLMIRDSSRVDRNYLRRYLEFASEGLANQGRGVAQANINLSILRAHEVPLPPTEEQRRIAAVLDAAEALRAKRHHALAKLESLTQAIFIELFGDPSSNPYGWPIVRLGEVLRSATYGTSKKSGANGQLPVLRMGNLTVDGHLDLGDMKFVDLDEREVERHTVHKGDVLFNRTNSADLVGKTAVYRLETSMAYAGYLIRLRPKPSLDAEYLGTFMNLPTTKLLLRSMCRSIVGMANINAREVQAVKLPFPPQERQAAFSVAHARVAQQRIRVERQLRSLNTLHASLQQRAFRGEL